MIPTREPSRLVAGDQWQWTKFLPDFTPADGWTLYYLLTNTTDSVGLGLATDNGDGAHLMTIDAVDTAAYAPGEYSRGLIGIVTKGAEKTTVYEGTLVVRPDPEVAGDRRSMVKKTLDALEATLNESATHDQLSHSIAGHAVGRMSRLELIDSVAKYRQLYNDELAKDRKRNGRGVSRTLHVRFVRP